MDADEKRIAKIFGKRAVPEVTESNLLKFRKHLVRHFDKKAVLTGREDFPWEEKYVFGYGSRSEYERLKQSRPSYTDEYELIEVTDQVIEERDLLARVKRVSDGKFFDIGLSWLTTREEKGNAYQLLDDFATWVVNW